MDSQVVERTPDGLTATENLRAITRRVRQLVERQYNCWREDLRPALAAERHPLPAFAELSAADRAWVEDFYRTQVRPVLTPLGLDPAHPFPQLLNKSLNSIVQLEIARGGGIARAPGGGAGAARAAAAGQAAAPGFPEQDYVFLGRADRALSGRPVSRHDDPGLLAFPRHPQQRALH